MATNDQISQQYITQFVPCYSRSPLPLCQMENLEWLKTSSGVNGTEGQCVLLYIKASMLISWLVMWGWAARGSVGIWTTLLCCAGQVRHAASTGRSAKPDWKMRCQHTGWQWPSAPVTTLTCGCYCERTQYIQVRAKITTNSKQISSLWRNIYTCNGCEYRKQKATVTITAHFQH